MCNVDCLSTKANREARRKERESKGAWALHGSENLITWLPHGVEPGFAASGPQLSPVFFKSYHTCCRVTSETKSPKLPGHMFRISGATGNSSRPILPIPAQIGPQAADGAHVNHTYFPVSLYVTK